MKYTKIAIALLAVTTLASGCKPSEEQVTSQQIDKVKVETKAAAQDVKDYAYAQREEFAQKMKVQIAQINKDLDALDSKLDKASDAVKAEAKPKLQALRDQQAQLSKQLDAIKDANETSWSDVKAATSKAFDSLKDGFNQSRQWLSDKIAP